MYHECRRACVCHGARPGIWVGFYREGMWHLGWQLSVAVRPRRQRRLGVVYERREKRCHRDGCCKFFELERAQRPALGQQPGRREGCLHGLRSLERAVRLDAQRTISQPSVPRRVGMPMRAARDRRGHRSIRLPPGGPIAESVSVPSQSLAAHLLRLVFHDCAHSVAMLPRPVEDVPSADCNVQFWCVQDR